MAVKSHPVKIAVVALIYQLLPGFIWFHIPNINGLREIFTESHGFLPMYYVFFPVIFPFNPWDAQDAFQAWLTDLERRHEERLLQDRGFHKVMGDPQKGLVYGKSKNH